MKKIILILGFDNTGKSTLTNQLSEKLNIPKILSKGSVDKETFNLFLKENTKDNIVIFERFTPIEEMVYGKILRNKSKFTFEETMNILKNYDYFIIYCRPPKKIIFDWKERKQMDGVIEKSNILLKEYDNIIIKLKNKYNLKNYIIYDFNNEEKLNFILNNICFQKFLNNNL